MIILSNYVFTQTYFMTMYSILFINELITEKFHQIYNLIDCFTMNE